METIQIKRNNVYKIDILDDEDKTKGTIEFDVEDIGLSFKCLKSLEAIEKLKETARLKEYSILKKQDQPGDYISKNEEAILNLWQETFNEMRNAMDIFLGDGACTLIFGDRNYPTMFEDLMEQLMPHIDKMGISFENVKDRIAKKYSINKEQVIE